MHLKSVALFLAVASTAAYASLQDEFTVKWAPKVGNVYKYKVDVTAKGLQGPAGEGEAKFGANLTRTILEVKSDGNIVVEEKQTDFTLSFDGQDMSAMMPIESITEKITATPLGSVVERVSDADPSMNNPRLSNAQVFVFPGKPLKVGETWVRETAADSSLGLFPTKTTFTFQGTEMVGQWNCFKVTFEFAESDASANMEGTGTAWLSIEDGELVKGESKFKNVEFGPGLTADAEGLVMRSE